MNVWGYLDMKYCNGKKSNTPKNKETIEPGQHGGEGYCKAIAGKGTNHVGEGRCKHHGGATPIKHGLYTKYLDTEIGQVIDDLSESNDILELRKTIAAQQKVLMDLLDKMGEGETNDERASLISKIADQIGKNRKRLHLIEEGEELTIHVEEVQRVVKMMVKVVKDVTDEKTAERVGERLRDQVKV